MPLLLSDASSCCSDLGRILYANPNEWNVYMNIVDTNTLSSFFSSHVEYQMSLCAIPCNSLAADIRFFDMWTRFRDVRRLWEQLADIHKRLHLHGLFPQFADAVIFGNRSAQIVGERTSSITTFLNFVLGHPVLRQSKVLQDFFEKAQEIWKPQNRNDMLNPMRQDSAVGSNMVHVSKCLGQDPRLLFVSESEDLPAVGSSESSTLHHIQAHPMPATTIRENSILDVQEKYATNLLHKNNMPNTLNEATTSQSSILPAYYCVALSKQAQLTQLSGPNSVPLQHDCSHYS